MPYMFAGLNDTVAKINDDLTHTVKEKLTNIVIDFIKKVKERGYFYSTSAIPYVQIKPDQFDN